MKNINEKIIAIIRNEDIGLENQPFNPINIRYAARAIVKNNDGKMAIFNKQLKNEYKLPGGGIEEGENIKEALKREILEETGCIVEIKDSLGITIEEKSSTNFKQISYIFECIVTNDTNNLHLTEKELYEKGRIIWVTPNEGYQLIKDSFNNLKGSKYDNLYKSLFMVKRDEMILNYYLNRKK